MVVLYTVCGGRSVSREKRKDKVVSRKDAQEFGAMAEQRVMGRLSSLGYVVSPASPNAPYDFVVNGSIRVEVKASRFHPFGNSRGRYQWDFHNQADVLVVLLVADSVPVYLVMPCWGICRGNMAICQKNPFEYMGKWAFWVERWDVLENALWDMPAGWQIPLFGSCS